MKLTREVLAERLNALNAELGDLLRTALDGGLLGYPERNDLAQARVCLSGVETGMRIHASAVDANASAERADAVRLLQQAQP